MIDYPVRLSTTEPNNPVGVLKIRQDDKGTQKIVARITTNSKPQDLTGLEVAFNMRTNDGNVVIEKAIIKDAKLGIIEYVVSGFATQKAGRNNAYFSFFIEDYEQFSTKDFSYFVTNSVTSEGIRGCDYIWRFEDLLEYVTNLANQAQVQLDKLINDVEGIQKKIDNMFALIASQGVMTADEVRQLILSLTEDRLDTLEEAIDGINATDEVYVIVHNLYKYPIITCFYYDYLFGTDDYYTSSKDNVTSIPCKCVNLDKNKTKIYVPKKYGLKNAELVKLDEYLYLISEKNKCILVQIGA